MLKNTVKVFILWDRHSKCQGLTTDQWFSPGTAVSSTNKTDRHDITEILLKVSGINHHKPTSPYEILQNVEQGATFWPINA